MAQQPIWPGSASFNSSGSTPWQLYDAEAGFANAVDRGGNWLWGFSPLMAQYKFLSPNRKM